MLNYIEHGLGTAIVAHVSKLYECIRDFHPYEITSNFFDSPMS